MNSGSGIAELMAAENRASQIVAEARIGQLLFRFDRCLSFEVSLRAGGGVGRGVGGGR